MLGLKGLRSQLFQRVDDCVYDMRTGRLGVLCEEGGFSTYIPGSGQKKPRIEKNPIKAFAVSIPAFALRTPIEELKPGDVVIHNDHWLFFTSAKTSKASDDADNPIVRGIDVENGKRTEITIADNPLLPDSGVLCVRNVVGNDNISNMLPLLLMLRKEKGEDSAGKMMSLMLLGNMTTGKDKVNGMDANSLLPFLMLGEGKSDDLLEVMLLQQFMGGGGGNGLAGLFPMLLLGDNGLSLDAEETTAE